MKRNYLCVVLLVDSRYGEVDAKWVAVSSYGRGTPRERVSCGIFLSVHVLYVRPEFRDEGKMAGYPW